MSEVERKEAEIIRRVYGGGYAHAENVLLRLNELTERLPYAEAIEVLHEEVHLSEEERWEREDPTV